MLYPRDSYAAKIWSDLFKGVLPYDFLRKLKIRTQIIVHLR